MSWVTLNADLIRSIGDFLRDPTDFEALNWVSKDITNIWSSALTNSYWYSRVVTMLELSIDLKSKWFRGRPEIHWKEVYVKARTSLLANKIEILLKCLPPESMIAWLDLNDWPM